MAKAFNGALALSLVSESRIGLDDTVGQWLPGVWPKADAVTVREMLGHTAGLPDYIRQPAFVDTLIADPGQYLPPLDLIDFVNELDVGLPPAESYEYSDSDNIMVGLHRRGRHRPSVRQAAAERDLRARRNPQHEPSRHARDAEGLHARLRPQRPGQVRGRQQVHQPRARLGIGGDRLDPRRRQRLLPGLRRRRPLQLQGRAGARTASCAAAPRLPAPGATTRPSACSATGPGAAPSTGTPAPTRDTGSSRPRAPTASGRSSSRSTRRSSPGRARPRVCGLIRQRPGRRGLPRPPLSRLRRGIPQG